jgi:transposase-like protein
MQRTFSKEFKFKVAMEAIRGDLTIAEIISKFKYLIPIAIINAVP